MFYKDLKITLLEIDKGAVKTDKKFLTSCSRIFLSRTINPKKNQPVRGVDGTTRATNKLFDFFMSWNALFKGCDYAGIKK